MLVFGMGPEYMPNLRFEDHMQNYLTQCKTESTNWEAKLQDRSKWRTRIFNGIRKFPESA